MARRVTLISLVTAVAGLGLAGSAQGATVIGQTGSIGLCSGSEFGAQVQLTGGNYTVPFDGTITSWSAASNSAGAETKLLVLQPVSGNTFNVVAKSDFGTFTSTGVQTFAAQIPVHAGEVIGDWGQLCDIGTGGSEVLGGFEGAEPAVGTSPEFAPFGSGRLANLSATVEPGTPTPAPPTPTPPATKHKKKCKKHKKHKRSAESAKKKKCKKKKKR
jgi:hypothetical protein